MAETDKSHVHLGRDGWLFLIGGSNRVMDRYRGPLAQWWHLRRWSRLIAARAARAERLGIRYLHVIVPEKLSVYDHLTDGLRYVPGHSSARQLAKRLGRSAAYLDLLAPLRAARDGALPLYLRTDSHWSLEGCLVAYRAIMRAFGATPPADIATRPRVREPVVMDLGEKLPDPPFEDVERMAILREAQRVQTGALLAAYEARGRAADLHTGAHVVYRNEAKSADPRCLILFGDSSAHFAPFLLTGFLAESFREVHFVWSSSLDWSYIEAVKPDILLYELAERFLARVPDDRYDLATAARRAMQDQ